MTTVSGVGAIPEPQQNDSTQERQNTDDKKVSIFDTDGDGEISVEEQKQTLQNLIRRLYEQVRSGFVTASEIEKFVDKFINTFMSKHKDKFENKVANDDSTIRIAEDQIYNVLGDVESEFWDTMDKERERQSQ